MAVPSLAPWMTNWAPSKKSDLPRERENQHLGHFARHKGGCSKLVYFIKHLLYVLTQNNEATSKHVITTDNIF